jgi:hypothetical protein
MDLPAEAERKRVADGVLAVTRSLVILSEAKDLCRSSRSFVNLFEGIRRVLSNLQ